MLIHSGCSNDKATTPDITVYEPVAVTKTNNTKLLVHYMPWFEDKTSSSNHQWGQHWTMATKNPDIVDGTGKRDIASYFYPLIGPYASSDKDVIEYHLLLMKYAGIDGIIIDWYGSYEVNDYAANRRNSEAVIKMLSKVGLEFSIAYEDRTLPDVVSSGKAPDNISAAQNDMQYLKSNYFNQSTYTQLNGKPLLLVFGPITLQTESAWTEAFSTFTTKPCFLTLWNEKGDAGSNASGEYGWVYQSNATLENFYNNRIQNLDVAIGSTYPGFKDFYGPGGWGSSMNWTIEHNDGATLDATLKLAKDNSINTLQLVSWNDFGEGTIIEPTREFGFSYLEKIGAFAGTNINNSAFDTIYQLYLLRKQFKGQSSVQQQLDQAFYYLVSMQPDKANQLIDNIQQSSN